MQYTKFKTTSKTLDVFTIFLFNLDKDLRLFLKQGEKSGRLNKTLVLIMKEKPLKFSKPGQSEYILFC